MKTFLILLALLVTSRISGAAEKPTLYNHISDRVTELDTQVNSALSPKFTLVDVRDADGYTKPEVAAGHLPRLAQTEAGVPLGGYVLVAYVVTVEGKVTDPIVLKSADKRLNAIAIKAMEGWRFEPAKLKDQAVAIAAAQEFFFETTPTEFVSQVLEPTGGKVARPKDWFYTESHRPTSYTWIISREEATKSAYTTGVRIQTLMGVKEGTGKSPKEFVLDFIANKKKEAIKVINTCEEKEQGLFTRICIETEEGPYHILYSLFWGNNNLDIVVISVAGTTQELWSTYAPAFDRMGSFELIDMKRFEK